MKEGINIEGQMLELAILISNINVSGHFSDITSILAEKLDSRGTAIFRCTDHKVEKISEYGFSDAEISDLLTESIDLFNNSVTQDSHKTINLHSELYHIYQLPDFGILAISFRNEVPNEFNEQLQSLCKLLANAYLLSENYKKLLLEKEDSQKELSLLHAIIHNIPDPLYVKDTEGRKILLNKAEAELLGAKEISEVTGKKDSDFYPKEVALKTEIEDRMIIETGEPVIHRDGILTTHTGKKIWIQGTKIPHFGTEGKVSGIIGISHNISEYKKIEEELRIIAENYQAIFNSFVDLYYRSDLNGTILELSPSVYPLSGYRAEELIGKSVSNVYADINSRDHMIQLLVEKGSINDYENLLIHKSGKLVPVSITCKLTKDIDGKPGYIEGTIRDISERKETDLKISKLLNLQNLLTQLASEFINIPVENSNEAVDSLISVIGNGNEIDRVYIFEYDFVKNTMSNTHEWCSQGISPEIDNLQQIPNDSLPGWVETHKRGEMLIVEDVSKLNKDEFLFKVLSSQGIKTLVTIPMMLHGKCLGFVGFDSVKRVKTWSSEEITFLRVLADLLCNVTDRKRTDEALSNREASLKAIFNNVPFQMWLKDKDNKYIAVNKPFMDYFSINSEDDVIGKTALDLWDHEPAIHFIEEDNAVMQNLETRSVEELIDFKHKKVWFEIFRAPIVGQNGQLLGTTGIARDINSRKNADKELNQAVLAAEKANEAKSKFLAIMSHEIRNPLNAVVGMVRMLHNAGITGPNSKLIENIKTSSDHLLMIINDILDFSKIESGEMLLEETNFDVHDIMKRVYDSHLFIAQEKNIELKYHMDKRIGHFFKGDPLRLQQVISNLTNNAIKFTPQGMVEIRCELEKATPHGSRIRFEVQDTGIGICPANQEKIFESFKQEDDTISRTHGGTGLGLAISKQIVELMGGKLSLSSKKNVGSNFYFSIDLQIVEGNYNRVPEQEAKKDHESLKGYSILLVEDNKLNQILATAMLETWGTKVSIASNGQEAVDILEKEKYDLILMDLQMPVMDGIMATGIIREKMNIATPILALSANVVKGIVEKCIDAGMQGYISKPFESDDLFSKIYNLVTKDPSTGKTEENPPEDIVVADVTRLAKMIGSDPIQLNKMISKFLEITPAYLAELNKGNSANDLEAIAKASHKIKSSIDLVSAPVMCELILMINLNSSKGCDIEDLKPLITKFNMYFKLLETQLHQKIQSLTNA